MHSLTHCHCVCIHTNGQVIRVVIHSGILDYLIRSDGSVTNVFVVERDRCRFLIDSFGYDNVDQSF